MYAENWKMSTADVKVLFLTDDQCIDLISQTEPRLVHPFETESIGAYKADMCRLAALYLYGGYYFDVDIEPIIPLQPNPKVDFISATNVDGQFFQAVLAVVPWHPIIKANLQSMLDDWYMLKSSEITPDEFNVTIFRSEAYTEHLQKHLSQYFDMNRNVMLGTTTLWITYERMKHLANPWILFEIETSKQLRPELMRPGRGWGCNNVAIGRPDGNTRVDPRVESDGGKSPPWKDGRIWKTYFYSRVRGTAGCPFLPERAKFRFPKKRLKK